MNVVLICSALLVFGFLIFFILILRLIIGIFLKISVTTAREESPPVQGESVSFRTKDGVEIHGFFIYGKENKKGPTVIFCHEVGAGWGSWYKYASFLPEAGYNVLAFDFRGHGLSQSHNGYLPNQWISTYEINDLLAALQYLATRKDVDKNKIGLFGISRGGGVAISCTLLCNSIKAIVVDSSYSTYETIFDYICRWVSIYLPVQKIPAWLNHLLTTISLFLAQFTVKHKLPRMEKNLKRNKGIPIFFIHGERDNYISVNQAKRLYAMAHEPKVIWTIPQARHNEAVLIEPKQYREKITSFFNTYLE